MALKLHNMAFMVRFWSAQNIRSHNLLLVLNKTILGGS